MFSFSSRVAFLFTLISVVIALDAKPQTMFHLPRMFAWFWSDHVTESAALDDASPSLPSSPRTTARCFISTYATSNGARPAAANSKLRSTVRPCATLGAITVSLSASCRFILCPLELQAQECVVGDQGEKLLTAQRSFGPARLSAHEADATLKVAVQAAQDKIRLSTTTPSHLQLDNHS